MNVLPLSILTYRPFSVSLSPRFHYTSSVKAFFSYPFDFRTLPICFFFPFSYQAWFCLRWRHLSMRCFMITFQFVSCWFVVCEFSFSFIFVDFCPQIAYSFWWSSVVGFSFSFHEFKLTIYNKHLLLCHLSGTRRYRTRPPYDGLLAGIGLSNPQ